MLAGHAGPAPDGLPTSIARLGGMRIGDIANGAAQKYGKPLDGVRILALEQMQALPFATQILSRLGADVVKVEATGSGESGRGSFPAMKDPEGRLVGCHLPAQQPQQAQPHRRSEGSGRAGPGPAAGPALRRLRRELPSRAR